jgi:hypothetical protein
MIRADEGPPGRRATERRDLRSLLRFVRESGAYAAQSKGQPNRYQLFVERAVALARPNGRIGLVVPAGLAADHGSTPLRRLLLRRCAIDGIVGFDNRRRVFPVHSGIRFLLLTASAGRPTVEFGCRLGENDPAILDSAADHAEDDPSWYRVWMTPELLERLSGPAVTVPDLRSPVDLAIAERAASLFLPLGDAQGWGVRFGRELNATEDRALFRAPGRGVMIVEGRCVRPFRVDRAAARYSATRGDAARALGGRRRARLAYRDVASATNRLTLIAAILPPSCVSTHTVFCLKTPLPIGAQRFLCALFNSFVVNYLARLRVASHVTTAIVERLPMPRRDQAAASYGELAGLARRLSGGDDPAALSRLNALVARLYQLTRPEFAHVLETFPLVAREERERALADFSSS